MKFKGFVLAAGFGTRLRPLTDRLPKPLIPFLGTTPLDLALHKFMRAGIEDVAVNSHYLAGEIDKALNQSKCLPNLRLFKSYEPTILGTGGCYNPLRAWLGDAHLVVYNGDVVSDLDLISLVAVHEKTGASATMALLPKTLASESPVFEAAGRVVAIGQGSDTPMGAVPRNFACAQILSPGFLDLLPSKGVFDIISKGYREALRRSLKVSAMIHDGYWKDIGNPQAALEAQLQVLRDERILRSLQLEELWQLQGSTWRKAGSQLISTSATVAPSAKLSGGVIVGPGCSVADDVRLENCVIYGGARVTRDMDLSFCLGTLIVPVST